MTDILIDPKELEFQLYDVLQAEALCNRERFVDHSRETFSAALSTAQQIAQDKLANHNALSDQEEPTFDGERVNMRPEVKAGFDAIAKAGFIAGREDFENGGMQLPETLMSACMAIFTAANPSTTGYPFLTTAAARVIKSFGSETLQRQYLPAMLSGRFTGTMALTEPQAGSSLADIKTKATPTENGTYRIKGHKVFISGGDHELSENIVHLVLAKIEGAPAGVKGISLFLVPKIRLNSDGELDTRNDVALSGLFHKLGYRGTTSTALNFGEKDQCDGYLIGEPHQGLKYMFQMMNEARLGVGFGAAAIAYRGYQQSLSYAKDRPQGRHPSNANPASTPIAIIEHADVKRMLLAQKAYSEGALSLCLYGARLMDDINTGSVIESQQAQLLMDLLTPIMKAWPSEYGPKSNDLAIQVLGGAGYTREYPVEQGWRDNRLNPIHEGTNGIQSLDLLGRKVWQKNSQGLMLLHQRIHETLSQLPEDHSAMGIQWSLCQRVLKQALSYIADATKIVGETMHSHGPDIALANSHAYLSLFGHTVVAWLWLKQAIEANKRLNAEDTPLNEEAQHFYRGKILAANYFFQWELPTVARDFHILSTQDNTTQMMQAEWY